MKLKWIPRDFANVREPCGTYRRYWSGPRDQGIPCTYLGLGELGELRSTSYL